MKNNFLTQESSKNIYILSDKKVAHVINLPMFEIKPIHKKIDYSLYDALIFTSKNAILTINAMDQEWKKKPAYVIAAQTAKTVEALGGKLAFVGKTGHGNSFALEIANLLKGKRVLYLAPQEVVSNLLAMLREHGVFCEAEVIYETVCKKYSKKIELPKYSTIIFSSPSTIKCFFQNTEWDESYKAVAIGETTAKAFPAYITPYIAEITSLESCVNKAIEINN